MPEPTPSAENVSIVLVGSFNPQIFQPAWFASQELIRGKEAEAATIEVIHPEIVSFRAEWFRLVVDRDRFQLVGRASVEQVRDLALSTFRLLQHTPILQMGINRDFHFPCESRERWHALGRMLAPIEPWKELLKDHIGLRTLRMQGARPDDYKGYVFTTVEPSKEVDPGVHVNINDHFEVKDPKESQGCSEIIDILEKSWNESMQRSHDIAVGVVRQA